MKILILNAGSSSLKYTLFLGNEKLCSGLIERIGEKGGYSDHKAAVRSVISGLEDKSLIDAKQGPAVIGHRIVHGADMTEPCLITPSVLKKLEALVELAPLHNGPETKVVKICLELFPKTKQVAVFDTAFHSTMPEKAFLYGIPYEFKAKKIRRYGFHGSSHEYVSRKAFKILGTRRCRIITCHLGAGSSIAAVKNGKCIDTSMGLTPLEGIMMATRPGDIDPGVILHLMTKEHMSPKEVSDMLNKKSGLLGISGVSKDVRDLLKSKNPRAKLALEIFCYRITKYIGAYAAALGGLDAVVFTAGIGQNSGLLRGMILKELGFLGIDLDARHNKKNEIVISSKRSKVKVLVIPTDEEWMISHYCRKLAKSA